MARSRKIPLISQTHEVEVRPAFRGREAEIETKTVGEHICWLIETSGCGMETAASIVGIAESTAWSWQARGLEWVGKAAEAEEPIEIPEGEVPYVEFAEGLKKARGEAEIFHLKNIKAHALGNWQASAWWLERVKPERYARRSRHEVTGEGGGPVRHEVFVPPSKEWEEHVEQVIVEAELAKRSGSNGQ